MSGERERADSASALSTCRLLVRAEVDDRRDQLTDIRGQADCVLAGECVHAQSVARAIASSDRGLTRKPRELHHVP
jgi:hypothetical protein